MKTPYDFKPRSIPKIRWWNGEEMVYVDILDPNQTISRGAMMCPMMVELPIRDKFGRSMFEGDIVIIPDSDNPEDGSPVSVCVVEVHGHLITYRDLHTDKSITVYDLIGDASDDDDAEIISNVFEFNLDEPK